MTEFSRWMLELARGGRGRIASVRDHIAAQEPARVPVTRETHRVIVVGSGFGGSCADRTELDRCRETLSAERIVAYGGTSRIAPAAVASGMKTSSTASARRPSTP